MTVVAASYVNPIRPATVAFADAAGSSTNPNPSYSFGSQSLGTPDPQRTMIVLIRSQSAGFDVNGDVDSVSVGGTGCTKRVTISNAYLHWTCWTCAKPTGTTGTVTINRALEFDHAYFVMFAAYDLLSAVPTDSAGVLVEANPVSLTNSVLFRGIVVAMANSDSGVGESFTWLAPAQEVCDLSVGVGSASRISGALISKQENAGTRAGSFLTRSTASGGANVHEQFALSFR
jgi:hypothetical protein